MAGALSRAADERDRSIVTEDSAGRLERMTAILRRGLSQGGCFSAAGVSAAYPSSMVNPTLQSAIEAMSLDERLELVEYLHGDRQTSGQLAQGEDRLDGVVGGARGVHADQVHETNPGASRRADGGPCLDA